ncbi:hypothetical protein RGZ1_227 [Morganella phage vB_MmoM_Rgz1]|nr:hypothetical protein RGZ1_227 [Morganella phage vB_MmoM_Rgz1]
MVFDIHSRLPYPSCELSNFAHHPFIVDGVSFGGMEGFLQGLKVEKPALQLELFKLYGLAAYREGQKHNRKSDTLWFKGTPINRHSEAYFRLVKSMYFKMAIQNEKFRKALIDTGDKILIHSIGKTDPMETILTNDEFCGILTEIRTIVSKT